MNPALRPRTFTVGGKEYSVAFDFNAIAEAEAATKLNILTGVLDIANANASQIRGLLCSSLQPDNGHKYTMAEAGDILQASLRESRYWTVIGALVSSISDSRPATEEAEKDPNEAPAQS